MNGAPPLTGECSTLLSQEHRAFSVIKNRPVAEKNEKITHFEQIRTLSESTPVSCKIFRLPIGYLKRIYYNVKTRPVI
jgi:hypothetical protein